MGLNEQLDNNIDARSKYNFLVYANSVIKSRAIPRVEDNLKPIHRKILYTLWEDKVGSAAKTKKCATEVGRVLAYSPHGDAAVYGALVRLAQWWKIRYPLIEIQGNAGNLLGDSPAASRYTETRLSKIGELMLEDINKDCVDFVPNYDNTKEEPLTLPSKFPYILCGNNSGIAVGLSSDIVSHNFTEVMGAINFYLDKRGDVTTAELMQYIKGPDFPTGGYISNGEDLLNIYSTGVGAVKVYAHYDVRYLDAKKNRAEIIFHDVPYGVSIEDNIKAPLKKLVLDDGHDEFEDITVQRNSRGFDITVKLAAGTNVAAALNTLYTKTGLSRTIKINNTFVVNGEPRVLNLKGLIKAWVDYRSGIISRIAQNNLQKAQHKLAVTQGLIKCMDDVDVTIALIRQSQNNAEAAQKLKEHFGLTDEQADAILAMRLSSLTHTDVNKLFTDEKELDTTIGNLKNLIADELLRYKQIKEDLSSIKAVLGEDKRLTEIRYNRPVEGVTNDDIITRNVYPVYKSGLTALNAGDIIDEVSAYNEKDIYVYNNEGYLFNTIADQDDLSASANSNIGAMVKPQDNQLADNYLITVTARGYIKKTKATELKFKKKERIVRLGENDTLICAGFATNEQYVVVVDFEGNYCLKLAVSDLPEASKLTMGLRIGCEVRSATICGTGDQLLAVTTDRKAKFIMADTLSVNKRGNKGQSIVEHTDFIKNFPPYRECIYVVNGGGRVTKIPRNKLAVKSKNAAGASIATIASNRII